MNKVDKMMKAHAAAKELMTKEDLTYNEAFAITWDALPPDPEPEKRPTVRTTQLIR